MGNTLYRSLSFKFENTVHISLQQLLHKQTIYCSSEIWQGLIELLYGVFNGWVIDVNFAPHQFPIGCCWMYTGTGFMQCSVTLMSCMSIHFHLGKQTLSHRVDSYFVDLKTTDTLACVFWEKRLLGKTIEVGKRMDQMDGFTLSYLIISYCC